ncbi:MAG: GntR family transcriptional regulator [Candidatus Kariarchaeaceae archaeon]|jgi:DNA-binding GntR family transcriptional regulator
MPKSVTKKDEAYQVIKGAILDGQLEATKIYSITELSDAFGVFGTPAREALVILTSEGLLEPFPRIGYQIKALSIHDALEIFHLRSLLEVEGVGLAAEKITNDDIGLLEENNRLEQELVLNLQTDGTSPSYNEGYALNNEFHLTIARASGNNRLANLVEKIHNELERLVIYDPSTAQVEKAIVSIEQHMEIIERLKRRDKPGSQEAMKKHIEDNKNQYLSRF